MVDLLALARYDHLQLYVEHTFAHTGHEAVWGDASPLTGQIIGHVDHSLKQFGEQCTTGLEAISVGELMHTLESGYTMAEERQNHGSGATENKAAKSGKAGSDELTFF